MDKYGYLMGGIMDTIDKFTHIPSLNLYYDATNDVYMNDQGLVVDMSKKNKRASDKPHAWHMVNHDDVHAKKAPFSLENMNLSATSVVQIVAVCIAIVTQYNMVENKITELQYKLESIQNSEHDKDSDTQKLQQDIKQLKSQLELDESIINTMQYRISNLKK